MKRINYVDADSVVFSKKDPADCSPEEIREFVALVERGDQVSADGLASRVLRAEKLLFLRKESTSELVAVAALKRPSRSYRSRVFAKAGLPESIGLRCEIEAGWVFVSPEYRGRRIGERMLAEVLDDVVGPVFATARRDNRSMSAALVRLGFERKAHWLFRSDRDGGEIVLFVRNSDFAEEIPF